MSWKTIFFHHSFWWAFVLTGFSFWLEFVLSGFRSHGLSVLHRIGHREAKEAPFCFLDKFKSSILILIGKHTLEGIWNKRITEVFHFYSHDNWQVATNVQCLPLDLTYKWTSSPERHFARFRVYIHKVTSHRHDLSWDFVLPGRNRGESWRVFVETQCRVWCALLVPLLRRPTYVD